MKGWSVNRRAALQLHLISGIGPRAQQSLLEQFKTPDQVLGASYAQLRSVPGIGPKLARRVLESSSQIDVDRELQLCERRQIAVLLRGDDGYPKVLNEIPDPPGALFVRGCMEQQDGLAVAIVGSRHATRYGLLQASRLARGLAQAGMTIISGLARGIDAAAHEAALETEGRTIAVLASGVSCVYPPEHVGLADEVAKQGAIVSESPPTRHPIRGAFPQRNRLISGMCLGTLVVEAGERSGALITARHSLEQGREVLAVPGRVDSRMSRGCHQLLRDGARLVEHVDDVLEELCPLHAPVLRSTGEQVRHPRELRLDEQERRVLNAIPVEATCVDTIVDTCRLSVPQVLATISVLESRRLIRRISGALVARI